MILSAFDQEKRPALVGIPLVAASRVPSNPNRHYREKAERE
jgi:hypothetical protein